MMLLAIAVKLMATAVLALGAAVVGDEVRAAVYQRSWAVASAGVIGVVGLLVALITVWLLPLQ